MTEEELFAHFEKQMEEMPCESPMHGRSEQHEGPGVWYMTSSCPVCMEGPPRALVCDRYKQFLPIMVAVSEDVVVQCSHCEAYFMHRNIIYHFERREP